jgi:zinc transporter ZupT
MIVFSKIMEHIMDGISLGVVFTSNFDIAFSTFIAIFAHEMPQQMGALGVLIGSGFTSK